MQKRFSEMCREELEREAERLKEENQNKYKEGRISEANIAKQRYYFCLSYLADPTQIEVGTTYQIQGESDLFLVDYLNGVMAWGYRNGDNNSEMDAIPIGQLVEKIEFTGCGANCGCKH